MTKAKKRIRILWLLVPVLVVALCFPAMGAEKSFKGVTLTIPMLEWPPTTITKELTPEFERQTGIKVRYDVLPWEPVHEKITMELAARNPTYDVLSVDDTWTGQYIRGGHLMPIPWEEWKKDPTFNSEDISLSKIEGYGISPFGEAGVVYAVPFTTDMRLIFYRKDLFNDPKYKAEFQLKYGYELRPPVTWNKYLDVARFFTRDRDGDGRIDLYGTTMMGSAGFAACSDFVIQLFGRGGRMLNPETLEPDFTSPEGLKALQFYVDLYRKYKVVAPDSINYALDETCAQMQMDKAAMVDTWMSFWPRFQDHDKSLVVGKVGATPLPVDPEGYPRSPLGGWCLVVSNYSRHKEASLAYIKWFLSSETQKKLAERGIAGCRYSVLTVPEIVQKNPHFPAVTESLRYGKPFMIPVVPEFMEIWNTMSRYVQRALLGQLSPEKALDGAAAEVKTILTRAGYYK